MSQSFHQARTTCSNYNYKNNFIIKNWISSIRALWTCHFKSFHDLLATTNQEKHLQIYRIEDTTQAYYPRHFAQVPAKPKYFY